LDYRELWALALSAILVNAPAAQTVNGVPNPPTQFNPHQTNREFGEINVAVHALPPAGQPANVAGTAPNSPMQQKNRLMSAAEFNRLFGGLNQTAPTLPAPVQPEPPPSR
jgi:hypothetical protein